MLDSERATRERPPRSSARPGGRVSQRGAGLLGPALRLPLRREARHHALGLERVVGDQMAKWRELVASYEFVRGGISSFAYLDYYTSLATVRGAEARRRQAVAFDIDPLGKKRVLDSVP